MHRTNILQHRFDRPVFRTEKVADIRRQIDAGEYETDDKLDTVAGIVLNNLAPLTPRDEWRVKSLLERVADEHIAAAEADAQRRIGQALTPMEVSMNNGGSDAVVFATVLSGLFAVAFGIALYFGW